MNLAKVSKEELARREGIGYAIRYLEQGHTLDELKLEAKFRGAYNIPLKATEKDMNEFINRNTAIVFDRMTELFCFVLRTEYKFGEKRIGRFLDQVQDVTKEIRSGNLYDWDDLKYLLEKELRLREEGKAS